MFLNNLLKGKFTRSPDRMMRVSRFKSQHDENPFMLSINYMIVATMYINYKYNIYMYINTNNCGKERKIGADEKDEK